MCVAQHANTSTIGHQAISVFSHQLRKLTAASAEGTVPPGWLRALLVPPSTQEHRSPCISHAGWEPSVYISCASSGCEHTHFCVPNTQNSTGHVVVSL